jgi:hypothetical protein
MSFFAAHPSPAIRARHSQRRAGESTTLEGIERQLARTDLSDKPREKEEEEQKATLTSRSSRSHEVEDETKSFDQSPLSASASTLFSDGLQHLYRFCTMREHVYAAHTCRHWYEAAKSTHNRSRFLAVRAPSTRFENLLVSPLAHHCTSLTDCGTLWSLSDLMSLHRCHAILSLKATIDSQALQVQLLDGGCAAIRFPTNLKEASIRMKTPHNYVLPLAQQAIISALGTSPALLSAILLGFKGQVDLSPLLALKQLQALNIYEVQLTDASYIVLRQLSSLTSLRANRDNWSAVALRSLLSPVSSKHELKCLRELGLGQTDLTLEHCMELLRAEALTTLDAANFGETSLPTLGLFKSLERLALTVDADEHGHTPLKKIAPHLNLCKQLTHLTLHCVDLLPEEDENDGADDAAGNADGLADRPAPEDPARPLFESLSATLEDVCFRDCLLSSVSVLAPCQKLAKLYVYGCADVDSSDLLASLQALRGLRDLSIVDSFTPRLTAALSQSLQPPSADVPQLLAFLQMDNRPEPEPEPEPVEPQAPGEEGGEAEGEEGDEEQGLGLFD